MTEASDHPFDRGLQAERTALAWQRTALALGVAAFMAARQLTNLFSTASLVIGVLGAAIMLLLFVVGQRRYLSNHAHVVAARTMHVPLDGAVPLAFCALITSTISVAGLIFIFF